MPQQPQLSDTLRLHNEIFILAALPVPRAPPRWRELHPNEATEIQSLRDRTMRTACGTSSKSFDQPLSFRRSEIRKLQQARYLVALKTDGERAQLFLTRRNAAPTAFLLFRSGKACEVEVEAAESLFMGTVVDGELVVDTAKTVFLAFDLLVLGGKSFGEKRYTERHAEIRAICGADDAGGAGGAPPRLRLATQSRIELNVKAVAPAALCASVWRGRSAQQHLNDGLIFTEEEGDGCYKWKHAPTIDVLVRRDESQPYVRKGADIIKLVHLRLGEGSQSHSVCPLEPSALVTAFFHSNPNDTVIVEAFVERTPAATPAGPPKIRLLPARLRLDKDRPNHVHTAAEVAFASIERVSPEELAERLRCV